jgi:glycerate kinase
VAAFYGLMGDGQTAVIEMAAASGLELVPPAQRNPLRTTSFGTGQLIRHALDAGARRFVLGIGGSATNDGGAGMLQALGGRCSTPAAPISLGGAALNLLDRIDLSGLDARIKECGLTWPAMSTTRWSVRKARRPFSVRRRGDAGNGGAAGRQSAPLCSDHHARLALRRCRRAGRRRGRRHRRGHAGIPRRPPAAGQRNRDGCGRPGCGGGDADLVITGEGRIDGQTIQGKTPVGVARVAQRHGKPVIAISGSLGTGAARYARHLCSFRFRQPSVHGRGGAGRRRRQCAARRVTSLPRYDWERACACDRVVSYVMG